jgi:hypothetical protein
MPGRATMRAFYYTNNVFASPEPTLAGTSTSDFFEHNVWRGVEDRCYKKGKIVDPSPEEVK